METGTLKRRLTLIAVGGTISHVHDPRTGQSVPGLTASELLRQTIISDLYQVRVIDLTERAKPLRHSDELLDLARAIQQAMETSDGVVVTHGTDTLEEVAYLVDETVRAAVPIVFTGAMRPSWASGYDGSRNLENALRVATTVSADYGTLVTMHDEILEAWSIYKGDTGAIDAFTTRRGAARGRIFGDQITLTWRPVPRARFGEIPPTLPSSVPILMMGVGDDGAAFDGVLSQHVQGIVVASMAAGGVPPAASEKLLALAKTGLPIVLCSGVTSGRTAEEYYYPKAYDELRAAGIAIEDWLSPRKARIRLMLSLGLQKPYVPFGREFLAERG
jgi:L-asparaginase